MSVKKSRVFIFVLSLILLSFLINSLIPEENKSIDAMSAKSTRVNTNYKQVDIISTKGFYTNPEDNPNEYTKFIDHYLNQNPEGTLLLSTTDNYQENFKPSFKQSIDLTNYLNYTIPNGIYSSSDKVQNIVEKTEHQFLAANLYNKDKDKLVEYLKPYLIQEVNGIKIGVIGALIPSAIIRETNKLVIKDPVIIINRLISQIRTEGADLIILITHNLEEENYMTEQSNQKLIEITKQIQDVDGIIGNNKDQPLATTVHGVPVINTNHLGHLRFLINTETREVNRIIPNLQEINHITNPSS